MLWSRLVSRFVYLLKFCVETVFVDVVKNELLLIGYLMELSKFWF